MADRGARPVIFLGPSTPDSAEATAVLEGYEVMPPIRRHDLAKLVGERQPGQVVIVDGLFYHEFAVDHREISAAVAAGWDVVGMSSMGALRAAEMRDHGMRGFGAVFNLVVDPGLDDDELMCLHEPEPPFRAATLPLIEVRAALGVMVQASHCTSRLASAIIHVLSTSWFGLRRWGLIMQLLDRYCAPMELRDQLATRLAPANRIKNHDVADYLLGRSARQVEMRNDGTVLVCADGMVSPRQA